MKKFKRISFILLSTLMLLPVYAQSLNNRQNELAIKLDSLAKNAPHEIAYIQTSKDIYETGEDLWFKVYVLDAQYLTPSGLSKTLYLQLLNESNNKAVWQEKYEIQDGFANGRVYLDSNLPEGDYLLAAYTANSFFNDTTDFYAVRRIKIRTDMIRQHVFKGEFDKPFYDTNDTIRIILSPVSQKNNFSEYEITARLMKGNIKQAKMKTLTDSLGDAVIKFPHKVSDDNLQVEINAKSKNLNEDIFLPVPKKNKSLQFSVFPEGGYMVSGIRNKLAFKAVNSQGEPVDIKGTLFEDNTLLLNFNSSHAGMGYFGFTPDNRKKYFIRLSEPGIDSTFLLPEIVPSGIAMQLIGRDKATLLFKVSQSQGLNPEDIYVRIQSRGVVYGLINAKLYGEIRIKIPLSEIPQGIAEVTLFNSSLVPVAERLVYINKNQKLNITAKISEEINITRGKEILKISVKDENGHPVSANLGVSVFDKLYQNQADSNNILAHFFLSSQLLGKIYNPSFYFNVGSEDREEGLDLLMLTQGWRKYVWNESLLKRFDKSSRRVLEDGIKGQLYLSKKSDKRLPGELFILASSPNKDTTSGLIQADSAREFNIPNYFLKLWEDDYVYLKPLAPEGYNFHIKMTDPFETINQVMRNNKITYPLYSIIKMKDETSDFAVTRANIISIKAVTIRGKKSNMARGKFLGRLDSLLTDDYVCTHNVLNCPRHVREPGWIKPVDGATYFVIDNYNTSQETVRTVVYHSSGHMLTDEELLKIYNMVRVKAYYGKREFYKPNYDKDTEDALIPDYRNTLLWEPSVVTDDKGEATLSFFCSDINTDYVGRIEGVSGDGLLGTGYFKFSVRKLKPTP
jgi:hypothetical protein